MNDECVRDRERGKQSGWVSGLAYSLCEEMHGSGLTERGDVVQQLLRVGAGNSSVHLRLGVGLCSGFVGGVRNHTKDLILCSHGSPLGSEEALQVSSGSSIYMSSQ